MRISLRTWCKLTMIPILIVCGVTFSLGDVIWGPPPIVTSTLAFDHKPVLGKPVTVSYSVTSNVDSLRDVVIHLEVGRIYYVYDTGPVRFDVVMVDAPKQKMRTVSLRSLGKGETHSDTFTIIIPDIISNLETKPFRRPPPDKDIPPVVAAWMSFRDTSGKMNYDCLWGGPHGRVEPGAVDLKRNNFMASWWQDTKEKPNERNFYIHYWGPQDGDHKVELEYILIYENVRKALGIPETYPAKMLSYNLFWDYVERIRLKEKATREAIISRMVDQVHQLASQKKVSKIEAATEFWTLNKPYIYVGPPTPEGLESEVKSVAHTVQLAVEDFKTTAGREGIKPTCVRDLFDLLPMSVKTKRNPFNPKQGYNPDGGALVDGYPREPGQVGYIYQGQDKHYKIQGLGSKGQVILSLDEGD